MANELNIALTTGLTVTVQPYAAGAASGSPISLSEVASSGFYTGNMAGSAGTYQLVFLSGGATVGTGQIVWSGSAEVPVSTLTTGDLPSVPSVSDIRTEMDSNSTKLANLDATISSRSTLTTGDLPSVPSAASVASAVRTELTEISNLDASISSRLAAADYTAPTSAPTAAAVASAVRAELTELSNLDASVSSRLASADYTTPPTTAQIATAVEGSLLDENDGQAVLNAIVGAIGNTNLSEVSLVAAVRADLERTGGKLDSIPTDAAPSAASVASAVWSASTKEITGGTVTTLTNSPDVPTEAEIAAQVRTELSVELGRIDQAISTRLASADYTAPSTPPTASAIADEVRVELASELANLDAPVSGATAPSAATVASQVRTELTAELAKVSALNTERLANVATTAIVGNLIAQANS